MLDPVVIIKTLGLAGIFLIIFIESGLFFGFFLPGDTLLFASGVFAFQGILPIEFIILGSAFSAIAGYAVGYWFGKKIGKPLFEKEASIFFNKKKIVYTEKFYETHGPITIILARFIPVVRTFAPIIAGVAGMRYKKFFTYNIIGGILWVTSVSLLGYFFGGFIPNIEKFLFPIIMAVILFSTIPLFVNIVYKLLRKKV